MRYDNQNIRVSLVLELTQQLKAKGSWCGETHIQKTAFILKNFGVNDLDYEYILYKHGPYSFDLHGELALIRDANLVSLVVRQDRYGPSFEVTEIFGNRFLQKYHSHLKKLKKQIDFVVDWVGERDVKSLERLSTALMIVLDYPGKDVDYRAETLTRLKPHISLPDAEFATRQVDYKLEEARKKSILS
jgi:hypothetical protein